ncbi:glutaminase liver isoform, mitochondrial isoform X3 [Leopardus geoffroyi]|uniref:glutaminase n=3 Tax=Felinae TaxID=338152 RepID=A0ABI7XBD5_FELCA|nr:glutaminase liver isoform, mitochondrial isoform X3 [Felis catus]XP_026927272.1 glutaminase liver isoform, mitochondrial isoform X3 [Acinonyx jubatus]XP_042802821.1 glutaminase liver isoform, mitochondrial isoform X3 [Panthera leo]XP_042848481.1 glutaminase liver isoform, mitochondrial isoform X3 [Panthera tigris]XP_043420401.1 glutaminase liver isoform, mitochondrial isoform X3 [Prionailurus bengalensis]XP_045319283.1 glutaminase liver isoform, mitochondrial isoform X3 [Leopardus geoffroyi
MRSMRALQNALSGAGSHCWLGGWGHLSRSPLLGGGVRHHLSEAAALGRETPHSHQPQHRDHDSSESGMLSRLGDLLFYTIAEGQERIPIHKFTTALKATGLQTSDPRLRDCMSQMRRMVRESSSGGLLDRDLFQKCVSSNIVLLTQAFRKKFVIPDFEEFTSHVDRIFEDAKELTGGKVAAYIPQLAKSNPDLWGVSLCTVDGQRHSVGHTKIPFCLQSCVKPLTYAISISTLGTDYVHKFVGKEPSGLRYNKLSLNEEGIPHNPMVNAGAIVVSSLIKMDCNKAEKFDFVLQYLNKMAGNEYMGFSNATFQSEKETGDRNYAIGYYLKEKKCFPKGVDMMAALDLYFQVGLPAKSAVSGAILLVVPNVMGMMCLSPPLDKLGNSHRGISFCQKLVSLFNFHNYDNLRHCARKLDPRREGGEVRNKTVVNLLFAAYSGDVSALRRFALSAMDMEQKDYDSRTALHVAAAEGHIEVVKFLIEACKVNPFVKDRWGNIPLDDAVQFNHLEVVKLLQDYQDSYTPSETQAEAAAEALSKENLESMV